MSVGDFNGNGQDTIGLHRESTGLVYFRNTNTTGIADNQFYFGDPGDRFMAGDWTGDGIDTPGLFRPWNRTIYLRYTNTQGNADEERTVGGSGGLLPISGRLTNCDSQSSIPVSECEALVDFFHATNGQSWEYGTGWLTDPDPCTWRGVACDQGHVSYLVHVENRLTGSIPSEIGDLPQLVFLDLDWNNLTGPLPPELGNLSNLRFLSLVANELSGSIPPELGNLTNLEELRLPVNEFSGSIPPELGNLTNLEFLFLHDNELSGSIPPELGNLTNLEALWLQSNGLSGPVPAQLQTLGSLIYLDLSGQTGCLTAATPTLASWLSSHDPLWNDGCPA